MVLMEAGVRRGCVGHLRRRGQGTLPALLDVARRDAAARPSSGSRTLNMMLVKLSFSAVGHPRDRSPCAVGVEVAGLVQLEASLAAHVFVGVPTSDAVDGCTRLRRRGAGAKMRAQIPQPGLASPRPLSTSLMGALMTKSQYQGVKATLLYTGL